LIVFSGVSGSGKSTCLSYLVRSHPDFADRQTHWLHLRPMPKEIPRLKDQVVLIEELTQFGQLKMVSRLLGAGNTVIAASHLPRWVWLPVRIRWRMRGFLTDRDPKKIERYLARLGKPASPKVVRDFCRRYRANYTDVDCILERYPHLDFDTAYRCFHKFCRLKVAPNPNPS
jgi:hypothetical protein